MTWVDLWHALQENRALPAAGLALLIVGAVFRWFVPLARLLGAIQRVEASAQDQVLRLGRHGTAMMVAGAVVFVLGVLLL